MIRSILGRMNQMNTESETTVTNDWIDLDIERAQLRINHDNLRQEYCLIVNGREWKEHDNIDIFNELDSNDVVSVE